MVFLPPSRACGTRHMASAEIISMLLAAPSGSPELAERTLALQCALRQRTLQEGARSGGRRRS